MYWPREPEINDSLAANESTEAVALSDGISACSVYFPQLYTLCDLNACSQILDRSALLRPRMFACGFTGAIGSREMKQALQIQNREPVNFLVCRMCLLSERLLPDSSLFSIPKEDPQETKLWTRESLQTAHSYSYISYLCASLRLVLDGSVLLLKGQVPCLEEGTGNHWQRAQLNWCILFCGNAAEFHRISILVYM